MDIYRIKCIHQNEEKNLKSTIEALISNSEKDEWNKPKARRRKGNKDKSKNFSEIESRTTIEKTYETNSWFFEKTSKTESVAILPKKKKNPKNINYQYQDEMGDIIIDLVDIKRIIREYNRQLCMDIFYSLHKVDCFLEEHSHHKEPKMKQIL